MKISVGFDQEKYEHGSAFKYLISDLETSIYLDTSTPYNLQVIKMH